MLKLTVVGGMAGILCLSLSLPVRSQIEAEKPPMFGTSKSAEITPLELRQFAQILQQFQGIDNRTQQKMAQAIKKGGLSYERFMEIGQSQNNYNYRTGVQASPEELEKFKNTLTQVEEIIADTEEKKERTIQSQGLDLKRFRQIDMMVTQDQNLQQKVQQMVGY